MKFRVLPPIRSQDLPRWVPGELLRASDGQGWKDVALRTYRYGGLDVEGPPLADFMIVAYLRGSTRMERRIDQRWTRTACQPGDLSLLTRLQQSRWRWTEPIDVTHVYLSEGFLSRVAADVLDRSIADVRLHDLLRTQDPAISGVVDALAREAGDCATGGATAGAIGGSVYVEALGTQLAVQLLRHYASVDFVDRSTRGQLSTALRRQLADYIEDHLDEALSLESLAAMAGMGVWSFCKHFRATFQTSAHGYIVAQRVARARRLLTETALPLKAVAADCGFADQSHLTRALQAHLGCTPAALRRG